MNVRVEGNKLLVNGERIENKNQVRIRIFFNEKMTEII